MTTATKGEKKFEISVSYNGVAKAITVNPNQNVQAVLEHALNTFGIRGNRQNFGLFPENGPQITGTSVEAAGLVEGSQVYLRPVRVSGGG